MLQQVLFSVVCWGLLAFFVSRLMRSRWLSVLAFGSVLFFSLSGMIAQWDFMVLSESISLSLLALFAAAWLWYLERPSGKRSLALLAVGFLFVFSREVNGYLVLALSAALLLVAWWKKRKWLVPLASGLLAVFIAAQPLAGAGERWVFPFLNVLTQRILPDAEKVNFFASRGMPVNPELLSLSGGWANSQDFALYNSNALRDFQNWLYSYGKTDYYDYLLSHPVTWLDPLTNAQRMLGDATVWQAPPAYTPVLPAWLEQLVFFPYTWLLILVAAALAGWLIAVVRRRSSPAWIVPLGMLALVYPHLWVVWNGDAMEIGRHAVGVSTQLRLSLLLLLLLTLDAFATRAPAAVPREEVYRPLRLPVISFHPALRVVLVLTALAGGWLAADAAGQPLVIRLGLVLLGAASAGLLAADLAGSVPLRRSITGLKTRLHSERGLVAGVSILTGLLALCGAILFAFGQQALAVRDALGISLRLVGAFDRLHLLVNLLQPLIAWGALASLLALAALVAVFRADLISLARSGAFFRPVLAAAVIAAGLMQWALLYLRLDWLTGIVGWLYPYQSRPMGYTELLAQILVLLAVLVGVGFVLLYRRGRPVNRMIDFARSMLVLGSMWLMVQVFLALIAAPGELALRPGAGGLALLLGVGAFSMMTHSTWNPVKAPAEESGKSADGALLAPGYTAAPRSTGVWLPVMVLLGVPAAVLAPSLPAVALYPLLTLLVMWLGLRAITTGDARIAVAAGVAAALSSLAQPLMLALYPLLLFWGMLEWVRARTGVLDSDGSVLAAARATRVLAGFAAGGLAAYLLLWLGLGHDPLAQITAARAADSALLKLPVGLHVLLNTIKLNLVEYAAWLGLPLALLLAARVIRAGLAVVRRRAGALDSFALALGAAFALLLACAYPFGGTAVLWLFMLPPIVLLAGDELGETFGGKPAPVLVFLLLQLMTIFLLFRFQDLILILV
jgi:hypothetical protein